MWNRRRWREERRGRQKKRWEDNIKEWTGLEFANSQRAVWNWKGQREERRSRQKKRWEDNIKEWTGLEFANSQRAVANRRRWRSWLQSRQWTRLEFANSQRAVQNRERWREDRRRGRQKKRWEDNIREWTGLDHGVRQLPEGCGEQERMERAGCKVVRGSPTIRTGYGKSEMRKTSDC